MSRRVAVIGGGTSPEHDVALEGAVEIAGGLRERGHSVSALTIGRDGVWQQDGAPLGGDPLGSLAAALAVLAGCDAAFSALHGAPGEDGAMAGLLTIAGVPFVGCGVRAGAIAMDKHATKLAATALGIPVAEATLVLADDPVPDVAVPVVVKPTSAGSSFGVARVDVPADLPGAVADARRYSPDVLVEAAQTGREVHLGVLERRDGSRLLTPPIEFAVTGGGVFDTSRKYDGSTSVRLPAEVTPAALAAMRTAAARLWSALGCTGLARFDFFVEGDLAVLNEVNTMPGMTSHSGYPQMCAEAGIPFPALVEELVETAIRRG